jgi:drug/metabolite transporter (DMT)-like permease
MLNLILLALMPAAFSLNPVIGKALAGVMQPGQLTVLRWLASGAVIALVALLLGRRERWTPAPASWLTVLLFGALGMGFCSYAAYAGARSTAATSVSLFYSCTAALVVLVECATGAVRPTGRLIGGIALCLVGAALIITRGALDLVGAVDLNVGDLWAVVGTICWAGYTVATKRVEIGLTPFSSFAVMSLAGAVAVLPSAALETEAYGLPVLTPTTLGWLAALVAIAGIGAFMSYNLAVRRTGPIMTSAALSLTSVYTAVFAVALVGEQLAWFHVAGGVAVVLGLALINLDRMRG